MMKPPIRVSKKWLKLASWPISWATIQGGIEKRFAAHADTELHIQIVFVGEDWRRTDEQTILFRVRAKRDGKEAMYRGEYVTNAKELEAALAAEDKG